MRQIPIGAFRNNLAKSNGDSGFRFTHHELEVRFSGLKALKNRYRGLFVYASYNVVIQDSVFSDNSQFSVELQWTDNVEIKDTTFRGYTAGTRTIVKPPYFNKPCTNSFPPPVGLRIPTSIHKWDRADNLGANLTNIVFTDFDYLDGCAEAIPISFNTKDNKYHHFDYLTTLANVTVDGGKVMIVGEAAVKDVVIHDIDGSFNPFNTSQPGMFVSDVPWLKAFSNQSCVNYPEDISYCAASCYRTVSFLVDQSTSTDFALKITRETDEADVLVPFTYKYDNDVHLSHYYENHRLFSISLPEGNYQAEFVSDLQQIWPRFVLPHWEGVPQCEGYVLASNLTLLEPPAICDELIVNGDMEQGTYSWLHRNSDSRTQYGALVAVEGEGIDSSVALRHYNRSNSYAGIGQNLDTRCLHQNSNEFYEIELYFRLENGTTPFICNPFSSSWEDR